MADTASVSRAYRAPAPQRVLRNVWQFARRKPLGAIGATILIILGIVAVSADWTMPHDPYLQNIRLRYAGPSWSHPFGADSFGRDVLSRLMYGARFAFLIGICVSGIAVTAGTSLGLIGAYYGGKVDNIIQRCVDTLMSLPGLILTLSVVTAFGGSVPTIIFAIALPVIPGSSRLFRSMALSVRESEYILAARAIGCGGPRIILRHILPQVAPLVIIAVTILIGTSILAEASLGFLGFGIKPPTPTWGSMASQKAIQNIDKSVWIAIFPGLIIALTVLSVNLLGDTLRDILDPRLRGSGRPTGGS